MPNTRYATTTLRVVAGVAVSWVLPDASTCLAKGRRLAVAASAVSGIKRVRFTLDDHVIGTGKSANGLWSTTLKSKPAKGRHVLTATAFNAGGASGTAHLAIVRLPVSEPRVAVVTGASSGIGAELARALAKRGWHCVLLARREERLRPLAEEIGGEFEICDVSDRAAVDAVAARVLERHPKIHLLVNNAGIPGRTNFVDGDADRIEAVMRTNYLGSVWCLRAFLPGLAAAAPVGRREPRLGRPGASRSRPPARTPRRSSRSSRSRARSRRSFAAAASACTR